MFLERKERNPLLTLIKRSIPVVRMEELETRNTLVVKATSGEYTLNPKN